MKSINILLVEDKPEILESTRDILLLHNYEVFTAKNGMEAIDLLSKVSTDLIICDIMMPLMNGYELLENVRKIDNFSDVPFIFTSALAKHENVRKGMNLGADDYLTKPFKLSELLEAIEARLRRKQSLNKGIINLEHTVIFKKLEALTPAELRVLVRVMDGQDNQSIAKEMFLSKKTIENHRSHIMFRLDLHGHGTFLRFLTVNGPIIKEFITTRYKSE